MENIFNPKTRENWGNVLESKTSELPANKILCAAAGSFLLGTTLKIAGQRKIGSFIGSFALPLLALGAYRKYSASSSSKTENENETETVAPAAAHHEDQTNDLNDPI